MQDKATDLKHLSNADKKADLAKRVAGYPEPVREAVQLTAEDDLFLNHIGDRQAPCLPWLRLADSLQLPSMHCTNDACMAC